MVYRFRQGIRSSSGFLIFLTLLSSFITILPSAQIASAAHPAGNPNVVTVGNGSYAIVPPSGATPPQTTIYKTANITGAVPTNKWWSSIAWTTYSDQLYPHPLGVQATSSGLDVNYPEFTTPTTNTVLAELTSASKDFTLGSTVSGVFTSTLLDAYTDWTVSMVSSNANGSLRTTIGHGSPYVYASYTGGTPKLTFPTVPTVWSNNANVLGVTINNHNYGLYGPTGSTWSGTGTSTLTNSSTSYFSLALLPDSTSATLNFYNTYAYSFITGATANWSFDSANSKVNTTYVVTTTAMEGTQSGTIMGLYPHQWKYSTNSFLSYTYHSIRGTLKTVAGSSFSTAMVYQGVLPYLPPVGDYDTVTLQNQIDAVANESNHAVNVVAQGSNTYWKGKDYGRLAAILPVAQFISDTTAVSNFRNWLETDISKNLIATDASNNLKSADLFYYDSNWGTLIGQPTGFGSDTSMNDHHFHYGYWVKAAAEIAREDPTWAANYSGMINLLIGDFANGDRSNTMFPYLRNFDPYEGHSWASGNALFADGNNQESSSEAINAYSAMILWGAATHNTAIQNLGIYLYTTETTAIQQYWFNADGDNIPAGYGHNYVSLVWSGKDDYTTWWTSDVQEIRGINMLPLTSGSLYLGEHLANAQANLQQLQTEFGSNNWNTWADILWEYQSLYDPAGAIALYNANPGYSPEGGESRPHTYSWLHDFNVLGAITTTVTANTPLYAVFVKGNTTSHVAYNPTNAPITVTFSDAASFSVPAGEMSINGTPLMPAAPTGNVNGSSTDSLALTSPINLSTEGTVDWAHWGTTSSPTSFDHMAGVTTPITYSTFGTATINQYGSNAIGYSWTNGTPTASATNNTGEIDVSGYPTQTSGFRLVLPADTVSRTLRLYVGAWYAQGVITATLSDGGTPYTDNSVNNTNGVTEKVYALNYHAASANQTLTVTWTAVNNYHSQGWGNITLQAATLQDANHLPGSTSLNGQFTNIPISPAPPPVNLTNEGTVDWAHWGTTSSPASFDHMTGVTTPITYSTFGVAPINQYGSNAIGYSWTNGTPTASATNNQGEIDVSGYPTQTSGFRLVLPADTVSRTLRLYVGAYYAQGVITATLSDGGTPYTDNSVNNNSGVTEGVYTLNYHAASANQTLTLTWTAVNNYHSQGWGNITLQAATLEDANHLPPPPSLGSTGLNGQFTNVPISPAPPPFNLTTEGTADWAHWGTGNSTTGYDHKAGVVNQISMTVQSVQPVLSYSPNALTYSWTDGTPNVSKTGEAGELTLAGYVTQTNGFKITLPADTVSRTVRLYVGAWSANGKLTASLSDNSAPVYTDTTIVAPANVAQEGYYTINYYAASANQTLTLNWQCVNNNHPNGWGNVTLQSVTLQGGGIPLPPPPPGPKHYYLPYYDITSTNFAGNDWILVANPNTHSVAVTITIGTVITTTNIPAGGHFVPTFPGVKGGPVTVTSGDGSSLLVSQRSYTNSNFEEVPAVPDTSLSAHQYLPWFDTKSMSTTLYIANPDPVHTATVMLTVGGVDFPNTPLVVPAGSVRTATFPGKQTGPLELTSIDTLSSAPLPVVMTARSMQGSQLNEVVGINGSSLSSDYLWTRYDAVITAGRDWLLVGNPSSSWVKANVTISGTAVAPIYVAPGTTNFGQYLNVKGGPVELKAVISGTTTPVNVFASQRTLTFASFEEVPGTPRTSLSSDYMFTWYDSKTANGQDWIIVSNPSPTQTIHALVTIPGVTIPAQDIAPLQNYNFQYWVYNSSTGTTTGVRNGPVDVALTATGTSTPFPGLVSQRNHQPLQTTPATIEFNEILGTVLTPITTTTQGAVYAINTGGSAAGNFAADAYFTGGTAGSVTAAITTTGVLNPAPQAVYQSDRWGPSTYTFPGLTPGAPYTVRLHFAETYFTTTAQRKFNVSINATRVLTDYDVFAQAGAKNVAISESFATTANNSGQIIIDFSAGSVDQPSIHGIEITPGLTPRSNALLASFSGQVDGLYGVNTVITTTSMEVWQGKTDAALVMFTNWDPTSQASAFNAMDTIWNIGSIPLVTWEVFTDGNTRSSPANVDALIAQGQYDTYINSWAAQMKTFLAGPDGIYGTADDRRVYLRFAHEMNGNWYPWSAATSGSTNTSTDYNNMWKHVWTLFNQQGIDNNHLQWMWAPLCSDVGGVSAESYYPGDAYVNWIGIDCYNWGTSQSWSSWMGPVTFFDSFLTRMNALASKPIAIPEVGSTTVDQPATPLNVAAKSQWIREFNEYWSSRGVKLISWFNIDKETDWSIFGGTQAHGDTVFNYNGVNYAAYSAYKDGVSMSNVIGSNNSNPRLLTNAQFYGAGQ